MATTYNGTDEYLLIADDAALTLTPPWTLAGWFRVENNEGDRYPKVFSWNNSLATPSANLYIAGAGTGDPHRLIFRVEDDEGDNIIMDNIKDVGDSSLWQHVAIVCSAASEINVYCDGTLEDTASNANFGTVSASLPWYFARYNTAGANHYLCGDLAAWAKWDRVLALDEIRSLHYLPPSALPKDLAWYLPGLADAKEHWAGLSVTDNSGGLVEHPASVFRPRPPRVISAPVGVKPRSVFDSPIFRSPMVQAG